jgi:Ca2+-binding RTX toxin-like protein
MITVKAIKQPSQNAPQNRDDFTEQDRPKGRLVPIAFLLFLTGCAVYLKSFLPTRLQAHDGIKEEHPGKNDGEESVKEEDYTGALGEEETTEATAAKRGSSESVRPTGISLAPDIEVSLEENSPPIRSGGSQRAPDANIQASAFFDGGPAKNEVAPASRVGTGVNVGGGGGGGSDGHKGPGPTDLPGTTPVGVDPNRNRAPRINGPVYLQDMVGCQVFMISVLSLLAGASDPDGDTMRVVGLSSNSGTVTQTDDGGWTFVHDAGMLGEVKLTYFISDGVNLVPQLAYFSVVEAPPVVGTNGDDNILGTHCADTIDGRNGDDNIDGRGGDDVIVGGAGDDHIVAGDGNDVVYAGLGNDIVFAGLGNDIVFGGAGDDRLFGEDGNDTLLGEDGNDLLAGGAGDDVLRGGVGNDVARGDAGNDTIDGGEGNDSLDGGDEADILLAGAGDDVLNGDGGNDLLFDGAGRDTVSGGEGDDYVVAAADGDDDVYVGNAGVDTLDYSASTAGITVDVALGTARGADIGQDRIAGFEQFIGGSGDDTMSASATSVTMNGADGNDTLNGGDGNDVIVDGGGSDAVSAGSGDDRIAAAADAANDSYDGGSGQDTLTYATARLSVTVDLGRGRADGQDIGHDLIAGFERIIGGSGDDRMIGGSTSVSMTGGSGRDKFEFQRSDDEPDAMVVRKITDFTVGDRIVAATYEIGYLREEGADSTISDLFEDIYLTGENNHRPVRFHFEQMGEDQFTVVDVHDRPEVDDFFSIEVAGHHQLQFTVAVS